jgi:hypothetical protein
MRRTPKVDVEILQAAKERLGRGRRESLEEFVYQACVVGCSCSRGLGVRER